ncbi:toxin-antitoxin system YwqK family antitoxin [Niallia taxi]|uniref:toxin-antitoxin system YwqK family antitoxin n=1 Tax=Niallia taxi TaxID=2499688 RepID=UPI00300A1138
MENDMDILNKEYVLTHGVDFDEALWFTSYSDEVLDNPEDEGGKPFTGLAYEVFDNGNLAYYCHYENGFAEGPNVKFYKNGIVKSIEYMIKGQTRGKRKVWHENGKLKYEGELKYGVCLKYSEWDNQGNLIGQKSSPAKDEIEYINRLTSRDKSE